MHFHVSMSSLLSVFPVKTATHPADTPQDFHSLPPGMARSMLDRPGWPPNTLQPPFLLQHAPGAALAALFRFSRGIIIIQTFKPSATDGPRTNAAHIFPSSITIPCSIRQPFNRLLFADKYFFAQLMIPRHPMDAPDSLCPLRYFQYL
ncbi:MAG: hypothetical protein HFH35_14215 [Eubacterium sp.]|nr:hypothetical protein [Eubacterium sp.]